MRLHYAVPSRLQPSQQIIPICCVQVGKEIELVSMVLAYATEKPQYCDFYSVDMHANHSPRMGEWYKGAVRTLQERTMLNIIRLFDMVEILSSRDSH